MADLKEDNDRALRVMQEQHLFEQDKQAFSDNITAMKKWDRLYNGTKDILNQNRELPMSQRFDEASVSATDQARQVVNIIFQLVESQIDISVPKPRVDAQEEAEAGAKAKMVEGYLEYLSRGPELERINTENERIVKKNSLAYLKLTYDPNYHSHNFRGKIKITNPHPINIIPQKGIAKISQMDRIWHVENMSISRIARLYQDYYDGGYDALLSDLQDSSDTHADLKNMETISDIGHSDETRALIEKWYIDEEGDVGLLTYVDMIFLRDVPKYFYPRNSETGEIEYTEEIMLTEVNEIGEVVEQVVEVPIKAPKRLPIIAWYNVPKELSFLGKSDVEVIIDQQESIKKLLSIEEEKQVKGTQKIITRKGANLKSKITDATTQVLETDDPVSDVKVIDMKTHDPDLRNMYDLLLGAAKATLGVTDASQGKAEYSNLSGKAIQQLSQNTANRLNNKIHEKNIAFAEVYSLLYDFLVCLYNKPRPFRIPGADNNNIYGHFDKSLLVKQDIDGEYYYPDFDFSISADRGIPRDKTFILDSANQAMQYGAISPVGYWTILEGINFPNAKKMLELAMAAQQSKDTQLAQAVLGTLSRMSPQAVAAFLQKPLEEQLSIIQQVLGGGDSSG